jgi:hypothetical protein
LNGAVCADAAGAAMASEHATTVAVSAAVTVALIRCGGLNRPHLRAQLKNIRITPIP